MSDNNYSPAGDVAPVFPVSQHGALVELIVVCPGKPGSHKRPRRLLHLLLDPIVDGVVVYGLVQMSTQQQKGQPESASVHPVNEWGVVRASCRACRVDEQRRREVIDRALRAMADEPQTSGRVMTVSPKFLAILH